MESIAILSVFAVYFVLIATAIIFSIINQLFIGAAIGAIPLMCGFIKKKKGLGWCGLAAAFAIYWMVGFIPAQIASAIFTFLIIKDSKKEIEE